MGVEKSIFGARISWTLSNFFVIARNLWTLSTGNELCCREFLERQLMMFCRGEFVSVEYNYLCLQGICERYEAASNARPREAQGHRHQSGLQLDAQVCSWLPASRHGRCQENRIKSCFLVAYFDCHPFVSYSVRVRFGSGSRSGLH